MGTNTIIPTDHKTSSRKTKSLRKTNYDPKKMNENQIQPKSDRSKFMALQDALQDPIKHCDGF